MARRAWGDSLGWDAKTREAGMAVVREDFSEGNRTWGRP